MDNRSHNLGVAQRYNEFLDSRLPPDAWIVFLHHDLEFHEDPANVLRSLGPHSIYGPVGARIVDDGEIGGAGRGSGRAGIIGEIQIVGEIRCSHEIRSAARLGTRIQAPQLVDTLDSCCLIVHSSLIARHKLRFDHTLPWHFYGEDFSLSAWSAHRISTWAVQIECGHWSMSTWSKSLDFSGSLDYLGRKHHGRTFASTCFSGKAMRTTRLQP
ncbi:MAG: hypothetical protein WD646_00650 [Actinomycetota bacterium]